MTNLQVLPLVAAQSAIKKAIDRNYESKTEAITSVLSDMQTDLANVEVVGEDGEEGAKVDVFELKESADEAPVVKLVNMVLVDAIQKGASDIHFDRTRRSSVSASAWTASFTRCWHRPSASSRRSSLD